MTTAYAIQVALPKGVKYVGQSGKLQLVPKFFLSAPKVRSYIQIKTPGFGDMKYSADRHSELTKIITIRELENGLKDSKADIHFYGEWIEKHAPDAKKLLSNPKAIYKILLADKKLVSFGPGSKFGKVWAPAGHLRAHISRMIKINYRLFTTKYMGAQVVEIEQGDGINVTAVKYYPIQEFYEVSPASTSHMKWIQNRAYANAALKDEYK